jgi:hypothetical protein
VHCKAIPQPSAILFPEAIRQRLAGVHRLSRIRWMVSAAG